MKVHVIGGPGSGKTTLAQRIGSHLGCEIHHLDSIAYIDNDFDCSSPRSYRLDMVSQFTKQKSWVAEGVFFSWVGSSFKHSDLIILLSVDKLTRQQNIISKLSQRNGLCKEQIEKHRERLFRSNEEYDAIFKNRIHGFLKRFDQKIITLNNCNINLDEFLVCPTLGAD